ncbi:hypothetical protein RB595_003492 [Gaeumannomyces hyphopodioides]
MANQADLDKIQTWRQAGLLDPPAVLERLSRAVENTIRHSNDHGALENLRANFASVCSPDQTLTEASLSAWIAAHLAADAANPVATIPALGAAVPLLFRAVHRLSAHPFTAAQPVAAGVTLDGLLRVLFWAVPARELVHMTLRHRAPAEHRRALFQALAAPDAAAAARLPFDEERWRRLAHARARDLPAHEAQAWGLPAEDVHNIWPTRNDAGDEVVHDVADVLHLTQEDPGLGVAQVAWASFEGVAAELAAGEPALRDLVVGSRELRAVVEAMVPLQGWLTYAGERLPVAEADADSVDALVAAFEVGGGGAGSGANYEMFDRVLATVAPALLNPFHLLLEAFTKAPPNAPAQSEAGASAAQTALDRQTGEGIFSCGRLAQLRTFLQGRAGESIEDLQLKWEWDSGSVTSGSEGVAGDLSKFMHSAKEETFLLVRGSQVDGSSGESFTFGFYSARGAEDEASIEDICPTDNDVSVAAVFQLTPVQDAFPGILGRPAWGIREAKGNSVLQFGDLEAGASLKIDLSTERATFTHKVPVVGEELNTSAVFRPSTWRGSWEVELNVGRLELWSQDN